MHKINQQLLQNLTHQARLTQAKLLTQQTYYLLLVEAAAVLEPTTTVKVAVEEAEAFSLIVQIPTAQVIVQ
jgi:hypothetical protein